MSVIACVRARMSECESVRKLEVEISACACGWACVCVWVCEWVRVSKACLPNWSVWVEGPWLEKFNILPLDFDSNFFLLQIFVQNFFVFVVLPRMDLKCFTVCGLKSQNFGSWCFWPLFSHTSSLLYLCFAAQMGLLGFYHEFSLFTSPVTSISTGAREDRHCERESACGGVTR